jgi:hypothetical protein
MTAQDQNGQPLKVTAAMITDVTGLDFAGRSEPRSDDATALAT